MEDVIFPVSHRSFERHLVGNAHVGRRRHRGARWRCKIRRADGLELRVSTSALRAAAGAAPAPKLCAPPDGHMAKLRIPGLLCCNASGTGALLILNGAAFSVPVIWLELGRIV